MLKWIIGHKWSLREDLAPAVVFCAERKLEAPGFVRTNQHEFWVAHYAFSNHGRFRRLDSPQHWHQRKSGTLVLIPPGTAIESDMRFSQGEFHSGWMMFSNGSAAGLDRFTDNEFGIAQFEDRHGLAKRLISRAANLAQESGERAFWPAQQQLCGLIHLMVHAEALGGMHYRLQKIESQVNSPFVKRVYAVIERRLGERISIDSIAKELGISRSTLSHRFKTETGETPYQAMCRMRLDRAKSMLTEGSALNVIAERLAFSDAFHLSKSFKKMTGLNPREYLRML